MNTIGMPRALTFALQALEENKYELRGADSKAVAPEDFFDQVSTYEQSHGGKADANVPAPSIALNGSPHGYAIPNTRRLKEFAYAQAGLNRELDAEVKSNPDAGARAIGEQQLSTLRQLQDAGIKFYKSDRVGVKAMGAHIAPLWQLQDGKALFASTDGGQTKIPVKSFTMLQYHIQGGGPAAANGSAATPFDVALAGLAEGKFALRHGETKRMTAKDFIKAVADYEHNPQGDAPSIGIGAAAETGTGWEVNTTKRLREFVFAQTGLSGELKTEVANDPDPNRGRVRSRMLDQLEQLTARGVKFYRGGDANLPPIGAKVAPLWRIDDKKALYASADGGKTRTKIDSLAGYLYELDNPGAAAPPAAAAPATAPLE